MRQLPRIVARMGAANEVAFDPGKESTHVESNIAPEGGGFRILGEGFGGHVVMGEAVHEVVAEITWKLRTAPATALPRSARHGGL